MLNKMPLSLRLAGGFFLVTLLFCVVALVGIIKISAVSDEVDLTIHDRFPKVVQANEIIDQINIVARVMRNMLIVDTPEQVAKEAERLAEPRKIATERIETLEKSIQSEQGKALVKALMDARASYRVDQDEFLKLVNTGKREEAKKVLLDKVRVTQTKYMSAIGDLIQFQTKLMEEGGKQAGEQAALAERLMLILSAAAVALAVVIAFLITRSVLKQLGGDPSYVVSCMKQVEEGNLGVVIDTRENDRSSLLFALKGTVAKLAGIITEVRAAADALSSASEQVSATSQSLSQGASEQAASVEETSAAVEEMSASIAQNTENAKVTDGMASNA
ncbi:MAG: MCP four helix bundle domain-containing protein, partial [Rhodocyclaceae bacterium]